MTDQYRKSMAVHQTVLSSSERVSPLFLLTVPKHEVSEGQETLPEIMERLFARSGPVMSYERWREIRNRMVSSDIQRLLEHPWHVFPFWPDISNSWMRGVRRILDSIKDVSEPSVFTRSLLEEMLSPSPGIPQFALSGVRTRRLYIPMLLLSPPLLGLYWAMSLRQGEMEVSEEELITWLWVLSILVRRKNKAATQALEEFRTFDVPFALSKESNKAKLDEIIRQARNIVFVPLAPAALQAANLIGQSQFLLALEVVITAGVTTLVLAGAFSVAEFILNLPRRIMK